MAVVPITSDAHVYEARPNKNFGGSIELVLNGGTGTTDREIFLHAKPPPKGMNILSATLKLRCKGPWAGTNNLTAKRVTANWAENKITWNNKPASTTTNQATAVVTSGVDQQVVSFDVTAMMQAVSDGSTYAGITVVLTEDVTQKFYSAEHPVASLRPTLEIVWTEAPYPPSNLQPSGGQAVSLSKPVLRWKFADKSGNTQQASSQVQIATVADFSSTVYDSGKVANTTAEWDLSPTAFAGFTAGTTYYWRVQVWDGSDLASGYSDVAQMTRTTKPTLTITNPPAPASNTVDETSPVFTWTFTGQEAVEVVVFRVPSTGDPVEIYRGDKFATVGTSWEMDDLLQLSQLYRVRIRAWDNVNRANLPGDPDYVEATRDFTYVQTGGPAAVTNFSATNPTGEAAVLLEWTRSAIPDYFCLVEDGVKIFQRIDPSLVMVQDNLLLNPNFEVDLARWSNAGSGTITRTRDTGTFRTGVASQKIVGDGTSSGQGANYNDSNLGVVVTAGETWTASGYGFQVGGGMSFRITIEYKDAGDNSLGVFPGSAVVLANSAWTRATATVTAPAGAVKAYVRFTNANATAATWFLDDTKFEKAAAATTYAEPGTLYRFRHFPTPRVAHTLSIEAVVDTAGKLKHSNTNPSASVTTQPVGIWLADRDDGKAVQILGTSDQSIAIPENGQTITLVNRKAPVRLVDGVQGYVGTIEGLLDSKTERDDFLTLRSRMKELVLIVGDLAIPVRIEGGDAAPRPVPGDVSWTLGFGFFQVGEPWPVTVPGMA